jgi:Bacterial extracellular solute-binding protein, family 7
VVTGKLNRRKFRLARTTTKLGFSKVAKYYYYPGWWEGQAMLSFFFNLEKWNGLPKSYQAAIKAASALANTTMMARYDIENPKALERLAIGGAEPRPFSQAVLDACFNASNEVFAEIAAKNADFKEGVRGDEGRARARLPLVPARRSHLRHVHDDPAEEGAGVERHLPPPSEKRPTAYTQLAVNECPIRANSRPWHLETRKSQRRSS